MELAEAIILSVLAASTPLLIAATGELVTERSGVLNLGVEGMMIVGAACGFAGAWLSGSIIAQRRTIALQPSLIVANRPAPHAANIAQPRAGASGTSLSSSGAPIVSA